MTKEKQRSFTVRVDDQTETKFVRKMTCPVCKGTGWFLYKEDAPSPPYKQGSKLEFAKGCACPNGHKIPEQEQH